MKKSIKRYVEIVLTLIVIVGLFMPYVGRQIPIHYIFPSSIDLQGVLFITTPITATIPYLLTLIFKDLFGNLLLGILKVSFLILFLIILGYYIFMLIEVILDSNSGYDFVAPTLAILLSLNLLLFSIKYSKLKSDNIQNIILAIMTLPFITNLLLWGWNFNYGGYVINIAFLSLYVLALIDIFKNYKLKKFENQEHNEKIK